MTDELQNKIEQLARLRMKLDLAQVKGVSSLVDKKLNTDWKDEFEETSQAVGGPVKLNDLIGQVVERLAAARETAETGKASELSSERPIERVGAVVVHGIGEQRRFEHLASQVQAIAQACRRRPSTNVTVEILRGAGAQFQADQDSWSTGASARVLVDDKTLPKRIDIYFHEVWWADINEPYSLSKQLRFWAWGLSVWLYPEKMDSTLGTASSFVMPKRPAQVANPNGIAWILFTARVRLLGVAIIAVVAAASVGALTFLMQRLLDIRPPDAVRVFVNYLGGVKLYNQKQRLSGVIPKPQDFIDTISEPPRVSVRRRMVRTIADVALRRYDRWYIFAHSLGSIVALNGLMAAPYTWPGYLNETTWKRLRKSGFAGPATAATAPVGRTMPARPVWIHAINPSVTTPDIAYRSRIFQQFHGLLTFGSPLEKFATIWPARVALSREPAFRNGTSWINVYDPVDPVSGVLVSYSNVAANTLPSPTNVGYAASNLFLVNHLEYFKAAPTGRALVDGAADWLLTGSTRRVVSGGQRWFKPIDKRHAQRVALMWAWWIGSAAVLTLLGGAVATGIAYVFGFIR